MKSIKGEMVMDRELNGIVVEIFSLVILLIIAVPLCVRASSNYQEKKDKMYVGNHASVEINNLESVKKVIVSSEDKQDISIYLMLKISKFDDEYVIYLDDKIFRLSDMEYTEDSDYRYYNLGLYAISGKRTFDFKIAVLDRSYYNETISYSFYTKGLF